MAEPYGIVYLARNTVNGKGYVGQTVVGLEGRKKAHHQKARFSGPYSHSAFHRDIWAYGKNVFTWHELAECHNLDDLNTTEKQYISELKTKVPNGYNLTNGGGGASLKTAYKISRAHIGKVHSAETRQKLREAWKRRREAQVGR